MSQTIKETINGKVSYRKPSAKKGEVAYQPKRAYKNDWYFQNLQLPICQQIWEMGQAYYQRMQDPKQRPRHRVKNSAILVKLLYWYFLTGARQQEAFLKPYPKLQIVNRENETRALIQHVNEKHKRGGKKDLVQAAIPIFDEWEQNMWNFITDGGQEYEADGIFRYDSWKSTSKSNISSIFSNNFKTNLVDPQTAKVHKSCGITPHILRHMRSYNVLIDHNMKKNRELVKLWFGWNSEYMLDYYAHVRAMLAISSQESILKKEGFLTNLKVDAARQMQRI